MKKPKKKSGKKIIKFIVLILIIWIVAKAVFGPSKSDGENSASDESVKVTLNEDMTFPEAEDEISDEEESSYDVKEAIKYLDLEDDEDETPAHVSNLSLKQGVYSGMINIGWDVTNKAGKDLKSATFAVLAWDENKLPLEMHTATGEETYLLKLGGSNIANGDTQSLNTDIFCNSVSVKYIEILIIDYEDFDGGTWESPALPYLKDMAGQKYEDSTIPAFILGDSNE